MVRGREEVVDHGDEAFPGDDAAVVGFLGQVRSQHEGVAYEIVVLRLELSDEVSGYPGGHESHLDRGVAVAQVHECRAGVRGEEVATSPHERDEGVHNQDACFLLWRHRGRLLCIRSHLHENPADVGLEVDSSVAPQQVCEAHEVLLVTATAKHLPQEVCAQHGVHHAVIEGPLPELRVPQNLRHVHVHIRLRHVSWSHVQQEIESHGRCLGGLLRELSKAIQHGVQRPTWAQESSINGPCKKSCHALRPGIPNPLLVLQSPSKLNPGLVG
mmetsp:Transcript_62084/g.134746  ORF Transcript_62084/g.134746 Transcript_62084/m.134746 type:complete len:271 (-) Transcript_62084:1381-2193(-)